MDITGGKDLLVWQGAAGGHAQKGLVSSVMSKDDNESPGKVSQIQEKWEAGHAKSGSTRFKGFFKSH